MKKSILLIIITMFTASVFAQDYLVSFIGQGLATAVDSVQIENVSQDKTITVIGDDILHLVGVVNVETHLAKNNFLNIYPNPSSGIINIGFNSGYSENVNIRIFDITGKSILASEFEVIKGQNSMKLSGFNPGIYILNISGNNINYAESFLSTGDGNNNIKLETCQYPSESNPLKSTETKSTVQWQYDEGDILVFRGFSNIHSRILVYYITLNMTIYFDFILCEDADGYRYPVTSIGGVTYMAENLHTSKYNNNSPIPNVTDNEEWGALTTGARCYIDNDSASFTMITGALYNFEAVNTGNLCPNGWHVPTETEWQNLVIYLQNNGYNYDGYVDSDNDEDTNDKIAKSLCATSGWSYSDLEGVPGNNDYPNYRNRSGFSAISGAMRNPAIGDVLNVGIAGKFWSSTIISENTSISLAIIYNHVSTSIGADTKTYGQSVRCIRD